MGGLGNQMFQYAAAMALAKKRDIPVKFDFDDPYKFAKRKYNLNVFAIEPAFATTRELNRSKPKRRWAKRWWMLLGKDHRNKLFQEKKDYHYDPAFFTCADGSYVSGFWQNYRYFSGIADDVRAAFQVKNPPSKANADWLDKINNSNSVSVHIRRGDYVHVAKTNTLHGICSMEYYMQAINLMVDKIDNPSFFFFSDDMDWVKENISIAATTYFVDANDDAHNYEDMRLMSHCKHHIIANSSFSWWGAWLNPNENKIVVAPKQWINRTDIDTNELIPDTWIRL